MATHQKKADDYGCVLIFRDDDLPSRHLRTFFRLSNYPRRNKPHDIGRPPRTGFSFVPNCVRTWAPIGHTPVLFETSGRHNHSGIGYITRTPRRHLLKFHDGFAVQYFRTMIKGAANTEDFIFFLMQVHHYYGKKVIIVWDNLSAHYGAENYFEDEHPGWFDFEYLPSHSPELNPVEPCWNQGKHVYLPNFVPSTEEELVEAVYKAMERINDDELLPSFFKHAGLDL